MTYTTTPWGLTLRWLAAYALECAGDFLIGSGELLRPEEHRPKPKPRRRRPATHLTLAPAEPSYPRHRSETGQPASRDTVD